MRCELKSLSFSKVIVDKTKEELLEASERLRQLEGTEKTDLQITTVDAAMQVGHCGM